MAITPYLRLQKPPFDDIPWDEAVNTNMDKIDAFAAQFLGIPNYVGAWQNATAYVSGQNVSDVTSAAVYQTHVTHTSSALPTTFAQERVNHPTYWELVSTSAPPATLSGNVGRNLIHNPLFNIAQRGGGPFTTAGATTLDRWLMTFAGDTLSVSSLIPSDTDRSQIGDEAARQAVVVTVTGTAGAGAFSILRQAIEGVTRLSGKTVTLSFWAKTASGTLKLGLSVDENFGTGGSPSAVVEGSGQQVTLNPAWTRYSLTFTLPSAAGKTLGTAGNDRTEVIFWFSSGTNTAPRAGNIGVQSGTFGIWGVQLEIGSVATPLEKPDPRYDLSNCQRFYQLVACFARFTAATPNEIGNNTVNWQSMRDIPITNLISAGGAQLASSIQLDAYTPNSGVFTLKSSGAGDCFQINAQYSLSAEL